MKIQTKQRKSWVGVAHPCEQFLHESSRDLYLGEDTLGSDNGRSERGYQKMTPSRI